MGLILLLVLAVLFIGALPAFGYSRSWGVAPSGLIGLAVVVIIVLLLLGTIPFGFAPRRAVVHPVPVYVAPRPVQVINPPPIQVVNPPSTPVAPPNPPPPQ